MRISPLLSVLAIVAASLAVTAIEQRQAVVTESCSVLLAFMKSETKSLGSEFLVEDYPQQVTSGETFNTVLNSHPEFRGDPDVQVYQQMADLKQFRPTLKCSDFSAWLLSKKIKVNSDEAKIALHALGPSNFPKPIFSISMPGLSSDRKRAIIEYLVAANGKRGGQFEARLASSRKGSWTYFVGYNGGVP